MYSESRAALLVSSRSALEVRSMMERLFGDKRYEPFSSTLPKGYPAGAWEWIGLAIDSNAEKQTTAIIPSNVSQVFTIALWTAKQYADLSFSAWQHLRDLPPVLKYYASGRPQWRVGDDEDLEVGWKIPTALPVGVQPPETLGLPVTPGAIESFLERPVLPYDAFRGAGGSTWTRLGFIDRRSPLA